ncbi:sensor histidine kinase [Mongoliitalea daihaiensis]|uniref:sensor histidine kinase n=1 Tax=Mongoliitalea daihaiensis TaxID=2782006 RepID=UPI001F1D4DD9|nr:ATP-binding protein [Mongoliitalea daihaiensis]UJP63430.1 hypothetical protein IPZ59_11275 [Mongoliitalea daihaiensis]
MKKIADELKLYRILDSEKEVFFDKITEISTAFTGCEVGLVVFLDNHRQWFKASTGLDLVETPMEYSLCKELVGTDLDILIIPDLSSDPYFENHPALMEFGIKFYAGAAIYSASNILLGTVCVMDKQPRSLKDFQIDFLKNQAEQVRQMLELRRKTFQLEKEKQALEVWRSFTEMSAVLGGVGGLIINLAKQKLHWWPTNNTLFEMPYDTVISFGDFESEDVSHLKINHLDEFFAKLKALVFDKGREEGTYLFEAKKLQKIFKITYKREADLFLVFIHDETKHILSQQEINKQNKLIHKLERVSDLGAWEFDLLNRELLVTSNFKKILNFPSDATLSELELKKCFSVDTWSQIVKNCTRSIYSHTPLTNIYSITTFNGSQKWLKVYAEPVEHEDQVVRLTGSAQDVTEDILLVQALKEKVSDIESKNRYLDGLVNNQSFFIFKTNLEGEITFYNTFYEEKFIKSGSSLIGHQALDIIHEGDRELCLETIKKAIASPGKIFKVKFRSVSKTGEILVGIWDFRCQGSDNNMGAEILCLGCDISELEEKSSRLQQLSHFSGFLNNKLIEFSNITSHNIRSQVSNLKGLLVLLEFAEDSTEKAEYIQFMNQTVSNLDKLLHKIIEALAINNVENNQKERIELKSFINSIVEESFPLFGSTKAKLTIACDQEMNVLLNRSYLQSVFVKLLTNAIDYKDPQRDLDVLVEAFVCPKNERVFVIKITDNGLGMEIDPDPSKLFRLYQTNHEISGSKGFGLFFVKNIIEYMGGIISIDSQVNLGTTIKIELPYDN